MLAAVARLQALWRAHPLVTYAVPPISLAKTRSSSLQKAGKLLSITSSCAGASQGGSACWQPWQGCRRCGERVRSGAAFCSSRLLPATCRCAGLCPAGCFL